MVFGQIFTFLLVILLLYYAGMIVLDIQKAKKEKELQAANNDEKDIDISEEAKNFKTILITREEPVNKPGSNNPAPVKVKTKIPKEPAMTGGYEVEELTERIRNSKGGVPADLGNILHRCNAA